MLWFTVLVLLLLLWLVLELFDIVTNWYLLVSYLRWWKKITKTSFHVKFITLKYQNTSFCDIQSSYLQIYLLTYLLACLLACLLPYLLTYLLTYLITYLLTYLLIPLSNYLIFQRLLPYTKKTIVAIYVDVIWQYAFKIYQDIISKSSTNYQLTLLIY